MNSELRLFDTHTHLLDEKFDDDREQIINELPELGVFHIIEVATNLEDSMRAAAFAQAQPFAYAAVGVHPHDADTWDDTVRLGLKTLTAEKNVVAIGEIGLDYHYDFSPREKQKQVFEEQMRLAQTQKMPVVIHSREATADTLEILQRYPDVTGVMHCFSGSAETAKTLLDMGYYIAFGGAITFKNAKKNIDAAKIVPMARLLIETDCPYMTPAPFRGKRNQPAFVRFVAEKMSEIKQTDLNTIARVTFENAEKCFGV